jgi:uncharacterized protein YjbJ (UPF0337 family)
MNQDTMQGMWKQLKGEAKKTWGELTDDEIDQIQGNRDVLVGKLQEKYGYTKSEAEQEVNDFLNQHRS